jgi:hypothetical protein
MLQWRVRIWMELMSMKWKDYDDFEKKYVSDNNIDNFAKRQSTWNFYTTIGKQLKAGLLDRKAIYYVTASDPIWTWVKFRSVLEEIRKSYTGKDSWDGFEYLVDEVTRMRLERDPQYRVPENFAEYIPDKIEKIWCVAGDVH